MWTAEVKEKIKTLKRANAATTRLLRLAAMADVIRDVMSRGAQ